MYKNCSGFLNFGRCVPANFRPLGSMVRAAVVLALAALATQTEGYIMPTSHLNSLTTPTRPQSASLVSATPPLHGPFPAPVHHRLLKIRGGGRGPAVPALKMSSSSSSENTSGLSTAYAVAVSFKSNPLL